MKVVPGVTYAEPPYCNKAGHDEIVRLRHLLKRAHGFIKHGAASSEAEALLIREIEMAAGLKTDTELLTQSAYESGHER